MSIFRKKKVEESPKTYSDYTTWENDFGFLNLVLSRKKGYTKEFNINVSSKQLSSTDYIRDNDIEPIVLATVDEVIEQLGENYKKFLIEKYFGKFVNLVEFITEDIYVDLVADSVARNGAKVKSNLIKKSTESINQKYNTEM